MKGPEESDFRIHGDEFDARYRKVLAARVAKWRAGGVGPLNMGELDQVLSPLDNARNREYYARHGLSLSKKDDES